MNRNTVMVLGSGGLLGSGFTHALGSRAILPGREIDLCDVETMRSLIRLHAPKVVINAAGISQGTAEELHCINGLCAARIAEICTKYGAQFVFISSSRVFGASPETQRTEHCAPCPADDYGWSKYQGEKLVRAAGDHYIIRLPMTLGFRDRRIETQIVNRLIAQGYAGVPVEVAEDVRHSPVHVFQAVSAILTLVDQGAAAGIYHITSATTVLLKDIIEKIFTALHITTSLQGVAATRFAAKPLRNLTLASSLTSPVATWQTAVELLIAEYPSFSSMPDNNFAKKGA